MSSLKKREININLSTKHLTYKQVNVIQIQKDIKIKHSS